MATRAQSLPLQPRPLWAYWHLLSLDAPTVATVWCCAFASCAGIKLPLHVPLALAAAVWVLYATDRLLDASRTSNWSDLRERHWFHAEHRRVLRLPLLLAALFVLSVTAMDMPHGLLRYEAWLGIPATLYFLRVHLGARLGWKRLRHPWKELLVGSIFAAGVAIPAIAVADHAGILLLPVTAFAALCALNCLVIETTESAGSPRVAERGLAGLTLLCGLASIPHSLAAVRPLFLAEALSSLLLLVLVNRRNKLSLLAFRVAADAALLTPLLMIRWPL